MKKFTCISLFALSALSANAVEYIFSGGSAGANWSDLSKWVELVSWDPYTTKPVTQIPNDNVNSVSLAGGTSKIIVDGNYTTKIFRTNSDVANGIVEIAEGKTLTIDANVNGDAMVFDQRYSGASAPSNLTFASGTLNLTNTAKLGTSTVFATLSQNSKLGGAKSITFGKDLVINSTQSLRVVGDAKTVGSLNIYGKLNLVNPNSTGYKYCELGAQSATLNLMTGSQITMGFLRVRDSGIVNVDTALVLNLDKIDAATATSENGIIEKNGKLVLQKNGSLKMANGHRCVSVYGTIELNSGAGTFTIDRYLRLYNGSKIIMNSVNAYNDGYGNKTQGSASMWLNSGAIALEVNASGNELLGFCFDNVGTSTTDTTQMTLVLGDLVTDFYLKNLSVKCDTNEGFLSGEASLTIQNFKNGVIKMDSSRAGDDFSRIFAEGFEDFRIENGYLTATAIPEPATIAALLSLAAMGLAIYRRRK